MKILDDPDCPANAKWKTELASMKKGDHFAAPVVKGNAIRTAAAAMRKKIKIRTMIVVWAE